MPRPSHKSLVYKAQALLSYFERCEQEQPTDDHWHDAIARARTWQSLLQDESRTIESVRSLALELNSRSLGTGWEEMRVWVKVWLEMLEGPIE